MFSEFCIYLYIIINASYEGIYVGIERKNNTTLVVLLLNFLQVLNIFLWLTH